MHQSHPMAYQARASTPFWQRCLRRCVRLYLALEEPGYNALEVEAGLGLIELEMIWYLLGDRQASALARGQAQGVLESAQTELLSDRAAVRDLLRICLADYYRVPAAQTSYLSQVSTTGCGGTVTVRRLAQAYWAAA